MPHSLFAGTILGPHGKHIGWTVDFKLFMYISDRDMWYPIDFAEMAEC